MDKLTRTNVVIKNLLWAGANPVYNNTIDSKSQILALKELGIEYIVNLQEEFELDPQYNKLMSPFKIIRLETVDRSINDDQKVSALVEEIYRLIVNKHKVFIHCKGGKGRTGVIVALLLAKYHEYGATRALAKTQELFDTRVDRGKLCPKSPQTAEQKSQVKRLLSLPERTYTRVTEFSYLFMGFGKDYSKYTELSNYYQSNFIDDYGDTWTSNEQYYQAMKAFHFDDTEIYDLIRKAKTPQSAKNLGGKVKGFDPEVWRKVSYAYMKKGLIYKFSQDSNLNQLLLSTGDRYIIESTPWDTVWGSGLDIKSYDAVDETMFKGKNLLGQALMEVRDELR